MRFDIKKGKLTQVLKFCNEIVENFNLNPILCGLHIEVLDNEINFICSNQTTSCKINISNDISISKTGNILIKCDLLFNIISKISEDKISFNLIDNSILRISTSSFTSDLNLLDGFSYPQINFDFNNWNKISLPSSLIKKINQKSTYTNVVSADQNNILSGINFNSSVTNDFIEITSTDSYHLVNLKHQYKGEKINFTLSNQIVKIINNLLNEKEINDVNVYINNKNIIFTIDNTTILSRIIEGDYPSTSNVLEMDYPNTLSIKKKELIDCINRGFVILANENKPSLQFKIEDDKVKITFRSISYGSSYEEIKIVEKKCPNLTFYLNPKFLIDLLKCIDGDDVIFKFISENKPILIKDIEDEEFTGLILPIKN